MKPFTEHTGVCAPMLMDNIDTDQIIPSREMKRVSKLGLGDGLFAGHRYVYDGKEKVRPDESFVLNQHEYRGASILLSGKNFGCGSSREHAVWALKDFGIDIIIAESFGRIFRNNCARNGLLAIELGSDQISMLSEQVREDPAKNQVKVDLQQNIVQAPQGQTYSFRIAASDRDMLLSGLDHIEFAMQFSEEIAKFKLADAANRPWAHIND